VADFRNLSSKESLMNVHRAKTVRASLALLVGGAMLLGGCAVGGAEEDGGSAATAGGAGSGSSAGTGGAGAATSSSGGTAGTTGTAGTAGTTNAGGNAGTGSAGTGGGSAGTGGGTAGTGGGSAGGTGNNRVIGYFAAWGVYGRNYHVKNIESSGSADKLTHINYAFANVVNNTCVLGDPYADYDKAYTAAESVDGIADTWDAGALRGSFNQLRKLKARHPHLKVLISLGGWTWSSGFSDAAMPANRATFVKSCVDLFLKDDRWTGLFDGIDIDWEYPGSCGLTCNQRPEDSDNFTALLAEFRAQLDATDPSMLLTIAAPAGPEKIDKIQVGSIHSHLDFINLMTYDMHGGWESSTNFHSPLYNAASNPAASMKFSTHEAVQAWLDGGTPANKLVVGVPFYGRGWTGVGGANDGLWQPASGAAPAQYEAGIEDYKVLKEKGHPGFYHADTQSYWTFNGTEFWSYDNPTSIGTKMDYITANGLGGAMFWELSGDTKDGELITAVANGL
jgi:chitinase